MKPRSSSNAARRATVACVIAGLLATAPGCLAPRRDPLPRTADTVLLRVDVPYGQERAFECGLATLSTLCDYHGLALPPDEIERLAALADEHEGLSGGELRGALRGLGLEAFLVHGTLDHAETGLYRQVDLGRPPLVMIATPNGQAHYCLFTGYDPGAGTVYVYDPERGHLCLPVAEFEPLWERARRFTLVTLPPPPTQRS